MVMTMKRNRLIVQETEERLKRLQDAIKEMEKQDENEQEVEEDEEDDDQEEEEQEIEEQETYEIAGYDVSREELLAILEISMIMQQFSNQQL